MHRRSLLAAPALLVTARPVRAQWAPSRGVAMTVPFAAGGSPDVLARLMAPPAQGMLGQPVTVENRTGAGAIVGAQHVLRQPADGHSVLIAPIGALTGPLMVPTAPYDPMRDFRHVVPLAITPTVLVVRPGFPANTVQEWHRVVQAARPGTYSYASGGVGNPAHLAAELYRSMTGADIMHIPFRGSGAAVPELLAGRVDFSIIDLPTVAPMIAARELRGLAVGTAERIAALPDLPTMAESILPGFEAYSWVMWWVPAATPAPAVARLNEVGNAVIRQPDVIARGAQAGFVLTGGSEADAARHMAAEHARWSRVIRERGIRMDS
ncbi:MAG: tripartite tricarboxylate transporter substrate-binding protein [Alphaproteobacteria bacterium]|nr:tripartite tricarboxylate transporter substrate-binding protein [Alphaproteobacteria bacterium]